MQGKRLLSMICGSLLIAVATPSFAMLSLPCGWYAEGNFGYAHLSDINFPADSSSSDYGGNVNVGYKFMPYFALEVGAFEFANTEITDFNGDKIAKVEHFAFDVAGKGIVPIIDSGFELFAKVGVVRSMAKVIVEDDFLAGVFGINNGRRYATGIFLGVGGQYYIWPELAVVLQWQRAEGGSDAGSADLYSIGINFILY